MTNRQTLAAMALVVAASLTAACGSDSNSSNPNSPSSTTPTLTAPKAESPGDNQQTDSLRPTLTVTNGTSSGTAPRTYEFQISDTSDFAASSASFISSYKVIVSATAVPEGTGGKTSYTPTSDLQPTTKFYWRARMVQGSAISEWTATQSFKTKLVGYNRAGELYDPLIHGETVGDRVGATEFVAGRGIKLLTFTSYVRYLLPQTVQTGEYSMDVEGLAADGPGDKAKVFGMQEGQGDFVTNLWRVDAQYRGTQGVPPNCIQWRAMFGGDDHKIEPATDVRFASVYRLDPNRTYRWRATWDRGFRLEVFDGASTAPFYNQWAETNQVYRANPHYAYLGAPVGRSGNESATIPGTIYRNVWLSTKPRPASLGSAIELR